MAEPIKWPFSYYNATSLVAAADNLSRLRRALNTIFSNNVISFCQTFYVYGGDSTSGPCTWFIGHDGDSAGVVINSQQTFEDGLAVGYFGGSAVVMCGLSELSTDPCSKMLVDKVAVYSDQGTTEKAALNSNGTVTTSIAATSMIAAMSLFVQTASVTVTNTIASTTLIGTGSGTVTIGASYASSGTLIRLAASGTISTAASPGTLKLQLKLGSDVLCETDTFELTGSASGYEWSLEISAVCRSAGVSGSLIARGKLIVQNPDCSGEFSSALVVVFVPVTTVVDTTSAKAFDLTATFSVADAANVLNCEHLSVERVR